MAKPNKLTPGAINKHTLLKSRAQSAANKGNRAAVSAGFNRTVRNIPRPTESSQVFQYNTDKQALRGDPVKMKFTMSQMVLNPEQLNNVTLANDGAISFTASPRTTKLSPPPTIDEPPRKQTITAQVPHSLKGTSDFSGIGTRRGSNRNVLGTSASKDGPILVLNSEKRQIEN